MSVQEGDKILFVNIKSEMLGMRARIVIYSLVINQETTTIYDDYVEESHSLYIDECLRDMDGSKNKILSYTNSQSPILNQITHLLLKGYHLHYFTADRIVEANRFL